jgi:hypothetical protein
MVKKYAGENHNDPTSDERKCKYHESDGRCYLERKYIKQLNGEYKICDPSVCILHTIEQIIRLKREKSIVIVKSLDQSYFDNI